MQIHPDGVLDHLGCASLEIDLLNVLRIQIVLDVLFTDDLNPERFENLQILVGLDGVNDVGRQNLVEFFVRHISAVRLAAALDVVDDVVELRLAKNRHPFHRGEHEIGVGSVDILVGGNGRQRRNDVLDVIFISF